MSRRVNKNQSKLKFDFQKTVEYWLDGARYDMDTATTMYEKGRYPYALFVGHLAIEKLLKALVVARTGEHAPYTHSLPLLAAKLDFKLPRALLKHLSRFMEFHFEARYPDEQKKFYRKCTKEFTKRNMQHVGKAFQWLIEKSEKK